MCEYGYGLIDGLDWIKRVCVSHPEYINAQNKDGKTPIMLCTTWGNKDREEIIRYLLERGAEMNIHSPNVKCHSNLQTIIDHF